MMLLVPRGTSADAAGAAPAHRLTTDRVWRELEKRTFAVLGYVSSTGKPRTSGVICVVERPRLYVVTASNSWKAREIADGAEVAVTVPIRRGGVLSLVAPIPPATVSFHARATVHPAGSVTIESMSKRLAGLLPEKGKGGCLLQLVPEGRFVTYGVGVSLRDMIKPDIALAHAPVS